MMMSECILQSWVTELFVNSPKTVFVHLLKLSKLNLNLFALCGGLHLILCKPTRRISLNLTAGDPDVQLAVKFKLILRVGIIQSERSVHTGAHHLSAGECILTSSYTVQSFYPSGATMLLNRGSPEEL